jgi:transcriptional regulator with PAS, ATPase and Fis domain
LLAEQFVERFNRLQRKAVKGVSAEALSPLMAYDWPGNVRELGNVIERSFMLCNEGFIDIPHLPEDLMGHGASTPFARYSNGPRTARRPIHRRALERNDYNRLAAARELGIHETTLFRRTRKLGIPLPERDGRSARRQ